MLHLQCLSYNIHKGRSFGNFNEVLARIREGIRLVSPDLVLLQEVMGRDADSEELPADKQQFEFLADEVWTHFAYGQNAVYDEGDHGNAILSRYPISSSTNENVSNHAYERRGILHAVLGPPEIAKPWHVMTLHFDLSGWGRRKQLEKLIRRIEKEVPQDEPLIIGGDFNDWGEALSGKLREECGLTECFEELRGKPARTFPVFAPFLRLDRIYTRGFKAVNATVLSGEPWSALSDHAALLVEFEI